MTNPREKLPAWLRKQPTKHGPSKTIQQQVVHNLNTVCESAKCPNRGECFSKGTVTFMILGDICTRNCTFCAIEGEKTKKTTPVNIKEPQQIAATAAKLNLSHIVITSVTRDDLPDHGASQFASTIKALKAKIPKSTIEVLTPDFQGQTKFVDIVLEAQPNVFNHNIETVPRLYPKIRPEANYKRSLQLLNYAKSPVTSQQSLVTTKSGLMLGFGESKKEVIQTLHDLHSINIDIVTIGQYIPPTRRHVTVKEYIHPEIFSEYQHIGEIIGIPKVFSGPLVRSSYNAGEVFKSKDLANRKV